MSSWPRSNRSPPDCSRPRTGRRPTDRRPSASTAGDRLVEHSELVLVRWLEDRRPMLEVSPRHGRGAPLARRVASLGSLDELFQGRVEVVQLDPDAQGPGPESLLVAFDARPVAPLQDDALAVGEELLGERPQLRFQEDAEVVVPDVMTQTSRPRVLVQPDGGDPGGEL